MLRPRPSIGEIADALFPSSIRKNGRFVTVFTTYLDVSRDMGDSNTYVVAGFTSDKERWKVFDAEWQCVLDKYDIGVFHMTDFESCRKEFRDWEKSDPRILIELFDVIRRNVVCSAGYGVSQTMYDALVPPDVNEYLGGSPYYLVFIGLVLAVENMMDHAAKFAAGVPHDWQMIYIIARGDPGGGKILNEWMKKDAETRSVLEETRTVGVFGARDNTYQSLQAADILAFEGRKQAGLQLGEHSRSSRRSFEALEAIRLPSAWKFIQHEHHLKSLVESAQRAMRREGLPDLRWPAS